MNAELMRKYMIGLIYAQSKLKKKELLTNNGLNSEQIKKYSGHRTAVKIAEDFHVSPGTVQKYYKLYRVIEKIRKKSPQAANAIFSKKYRFSYNQILQLSSLSSEKRLKFINEHRNLSCKKQFVCMNDLISVIELWIEFIGEINKYIDWDSTSICERRALCSKLTNLVFCVQGLIDIAKPER